MTKKGVYYRLNEKSIEKVKSLSKEKNITNTDALELMIGSYFADRTEEHHMLKEELDSLLKRELKELDAKLERVRVSANLIDRHTQMQLEFWNHYFAANNFKHFGSTELHKMEELTEAEAIVRNRIAHNRQRKLDFEKAKQEKKKKV